MPYSTDKSSLFTMVRTLLIGVTRDNIIPFDCAVVVLDFYNPGGGPILVSGMVRSVTHVPYFDARLQFCRHKFIVFFITSFIIHCMLLMSS